MNQEVHGVKAQGCIGVHPLDPVEFYQIPQVFSPVSQRVSMYEIPNVYFYVVLALVALEVEMFPNLALLFVVPNVVKVGLEPVHQSVLHLSHILDPTALARQAVDEVRALTCHVMF